MTDDVTGIHHVSLLVSDTRRALQFYSGVLGLEQDDVETALAARKAFYEAKRRGDAKAAQAALEGAPRPVGLWSYEAAWLAKNL